MKQLEDNKTLELIDPPKRGRGRPRSAESRTSAERMRDMRARRLLDDGLKEITIRLPVELIAALDEFIQFKDLNKDAVIAKAIKSAVLRKR